MDQPLYISAPDRSPQPEGWGWPMPLLHESIADVAETPFITRLLDHAYYRGAIFSVKNLDASDASVFQQVDRRLFRRELIGDFDILVVPHGAPDRTTAIQVKRFGLKLGGRNQVDLETLGGRMQRLFDSGVRQANYDAWVGFWQVYLWVFVLVDSREQNEGRFTYAGASAEVLSCVSNAISRGTSDLHRRVGLSVQDWGQPIDRPPLDFGTSGGHLDRLAESVTQPPVLTHWLQTL